jgi:hypothetical protein
MIAWFSIVVSLLAIGVSAYSLCLARKARRRYEQNLAEQFGEKDEPDFWLEGPRPGEA